MKHSKRSQWRWLLHCKSFKTCGISNSLNGTEDDELHNEEAHEIDNIEDNELETESEGESDGK